MRSARRTGLLVLVGTFLLQAAFVLSALPLTGYDEFEHVYKADATANGDLLPTFGPVPGRRGELMEVTADVATTVHDSCRLRELGEAYVCQPVEDGDGPLVERATAASRYHPAFYWLIGTVAQPFDGESAVTVMRLFSSLLCALLLGAAAWAAGLYARTRWLGAAFALCLTPTFVYSTSIESPNGLEMTSALALWVCLLGLKRADLGTAIERRLLLLAIPSVLVLGTVRLFGPIWLALLLGTALVVIGRARAIEVVRAHLGTVKVLAVSAAVAVAGNAAWFLIAHGQPEENRGATGELAEYIVRGVIQWPVQAVGYIWHPHGADGSWYFPAALYVVVGLTFLLLIVQAVRVAGRRTGLAVLIVVVANYALALAVTAQTHDTYGALWSGRYNLAFGAGAFLIAGAALDERRHDDRWSVAIGAVPLVVLGYVLATSAFGWADHRLSDHVPWTPLFSVLVGAAGLSALAGGLLLKPGRSPDSRSLGPSERVEPAPRPTGP